MTPTVNESTKPCKQGMEVLSYVVSGKGNVDAVRNTTTCTHVLDAEHSPTELANALEQRKLQPQMPYKADALEHVLWSAGLSNRFPTVAAGLQGDFMLGYPHISHVQSLK